MTAAAALSVLGLLSLPQAGPARGESRSDLAITVSVSGTVTRPAAAFVHAADDNHRCRLPQRTWLPGGPGPAQKPPGAAPNHVLGYMVEFGPDLAPPSDSRVTAAPDRFQPKAMFWLDVLPLPNQASSTGPIQLSRSFRLTMTAGERVWERLLPQDAPAAEGAVMIDPDMQGGRFHLRNIMPKLDHGRAPDSERITVSGRWRCPASR